MTISGWRKEEKKDKVRGKERTRETGFFLVANFCHLANKNNLDCKLSKGSFLGKKGPKLPYFKEK